MGFESLLDKRLLKWINKKGWSSLHEIQDKAIEPILEHKNNIIISAKTASGKTEAAFLPALSFISKEQKAGVRILSVSPLKALINDQARRLEEIASYVDVKICPWHGDVSINHKNKQIKDPSGIIIITPESLESLMANRLDFIKKAFANLEYIIIDEFHAFMGTSRGSQLQSLLHRLDTALHKKIVRIALSATFSEEINIASILCPNDDKRIKATHLISDQSLKSQLFLQIKGYDFASLDKIDKDSYQLMIDHIYKVMRGKNNLIFTNSKKATELLAQDLSNMCNKNHVPNEFFPHHGSLSKKLREDLEARLQESRLPTSAICTATLELGIDIQDVQSVAQYEAPNSVASLRQRLGRTGRRDNKGILRLYIPEYSNQTQLSFRLSYETFLSCAIVELLLKKWYEPLSAIKFDSSTLVQQIISSINSYGSLSAIDLYTLLCQKGPFVNVSKELFLMILKDLGANEVITQLSDKTLTLGINGERIISKYDFYTAFHTEPDFTIEYDNTIIGNTKYNPNLTVGSTFVLGGKSWEISYIDTKELKILVKHCNLRSLPLKDGSSIIKTHQMLRAKMFELYQYPRTPLYLDDMAKINFIKGQKVFNDLNLQHNNIIQSDCIYIFTWLGDEVNYSLFLLLKSKGIKIELTAMYLKLEFCSMDNLKSVISSLLKERAHFNEHDIINKNNLISPGKFDEYLSYKTQAYAFIMNNTDFKNAFLFLEKIFRQI